MRFAQSIIYKMQRKVCKMINIGSRRECFFDDFLIDTEKTNAQKRLHKPVTLSVRMTDCDLYAIKFE